VVLAGARADLLDLRDQLVRHPVGGPLDDLFGLLVQLVDRPGVGVGEADRVGDDGGQYLLEIERGGNGLADLAERLELADALLELLE
jgi:hypothetical protein